MTDEEIDAMEAGREMDALIAEHVLGWRRISGKEQVAEFQRLGKLDDNLGARLHHQGLWVLDGKSMACDECDTVPAYSTDIAAAWLVVEKLRELGLIQRFGEAFMKTTPWQWYLMKTDSFCVDVCRAALKCCKAVGKEI